MRNNATDLKELLLVLLEKKDSGLAKMKQGDSVIRQVIKKNLTKREVAQLTIKIDAKLDQALATLSTALGISKNRLIEEILTQSGVIEEVEENSHA